jgi:SlyX protein
MHSQKVLEQRLAELEAKSAHQESIIEELSDGISQQWETIDNLVSSVRLFKDKITNLEQEAKSNFLEEPPPHY